jgi:lipoprotein-anchoring transpeptidase ErfK/SrfK
MRAFLRLLGVASALSMVAGAAYAVVTIDIDLSTQRMHVTDSSVDDYDWAISSGRAGHRTPTGAFRPTRMYTMIHSLKYDNAPMPHAIFFTGGYAIHGTGAVGHLGHTASHGCVRLDPRNATTLFRLVQIERSVIHIHGEPQDAGVRMARRASHEAAPLAYAPHHRAKTLPEWLLSPLDGR